MLGESHGQRSLAGSSPGDRRVRHDGTTEDVRTMLHIYELGSTKGSKSLIHDKKNDGLF